MNTRLQMALKIILKFKPNDAMKQPENPKLVIHCLLYHLYILSGNAVTELLGPS